MTKRLLWVGYYLVNKVKPLNQHRAVVADFFTHNGRAGCLVNYPLKTGAVVYELGGFTGEFSGHILNKFGDSVELHVFEPIDAYFEKLSSRFGKRETVHLHQYGCGGGNSRQKFALSGEGTSLYRESEESEEVEIRDIIEILADLGHETIDLLSVNIEGGEYELFERLIEKDLLKKFNYVQIQFHRVTENAEKRRLEILKKLNETHDVTFSYPFVWEGFKARL